jgi:phosphoribosyl-ATP pyrophosphohydrolase
MKLRNIWIQREYLLEFSMLTTLENLIKLARERKAVPVEGSYTNKLLTNKNLSKAKVLEEVDELVEAIEQDTNKIHEAADVFYHLLMYLEANDVKIEEVMQELEKRKKTNE